MSKLTFLDLSRNDISEIPKHISQLESVVHLDLWDNYINVLPKEMRQLKDLKHLDIRGVAMSYQKYNRYLELMKSVTFFMSEPCDCQELQFVVSWKLMVLGVKSNNQQLLTSNYTLIT